MHLGSEINNLNLNMSKIRSCLIGLFFLTDSTMKYILVTGGVISGIGKGVVAR